MPLTWGNLEKSHIHGLVCGDDKQRTGQDRTGQDHPVFVNLHAWKGVEVTAAAPIAAGVAAAATVAAAVEASADVPSAFTTDAAGARTWLAGLPIGAKVSGLGHHHDVRLLLGHCACCVCVGARASYSLLLLVEERNN